MDKQIKTYRDKVGITPVDVLVGLGSSDRFTLATFLALFDDSTLISRLQKLFGKSVKTLLRLEYHMRDYFSQSVGGDGKPKSPEPFAKEHKLRRQSWVDSLYSDDLLRLLLWVRLRRALHLPARLSASTRGTRHLADDLAATLINALDPPGLIKSGRRWLFKEKWLQKDVPALTLEEIVVPVLDELLDEALRNPDAKGHASIGQDERRRRLREALSAFRQMGPDKYAEQLKRTGANRANDTAILVTALLGGGLGALGATVSAMGFGAYILAAKASAFIPMVSGPGLVSFVSVLTNPIAILAIVGGGGWVLARSAREKAELAIASRVIALLSLKGLQADTKRLDALLPCFASSNGLKPDMGIESDTIDHYREEWMLLGPAWERDRHSPSDSTLTGMHRTLADTVPGVSRAQPADPSRRVEAENAAALGALTLGDALYTYAAINPTVIDAADFARAINVDGRLVFSKLADQILDGSVASVTGGVANLKGYVAELVVAEQLLNAGHTVSFPEASNQAGWDLLVDGEPFQVKFHATLQGIQRHFERYDYPVIANTELHGSIPEELEDKVFFVDGVSNELVDHVTRESLEAGADLLAPAPIQLAGAVTLARGLIAYRKDQMTGRQVVEQVLLDGMVRVGLFGAGGVVGAGVGMMVFGPAGAWVFGAGAPVLAQMQTSRVTSWITRHAKGRAYPDWENLVHARLDRLRQILLDALAKKRSQLRDKMDPTSANEATIYLNWRLADDERFILENVARLKVLTRNACHLPEQRFAELLRCITVCGVHPFIHQRALREAEACLRARPGLSELLDWLRGKP